MTPFEQDVRQAFLEAKLGARAAEVAEVDVHFVLPFAVFEKYEKLIHETTNGEFNVAAGYNLVLLYTQPEDAQRAGTALFGRDLDGLNAAWSNVLNEIAADPDMGSRLKKFQGAHAYFRGALWTQPNPSDPCASNNFLPRRETKAKTSFLGRLLN